MLQYNKLESQMAEAEASWARELAQAATNVDSLNGQLEEAKRAYEEAVSEVSPSMPPTHLPSMHNLARALLKKIKFY